jgi:small-conductance mechanosensitive channel
METNWIQTKSLYTLISIEPLILLSSMGLVAWLFYKVFLRAVSNERHDSLSRRFRALIPTQILMLSFFAAFEFVRSSLLENYAAQNFAPYLAVITFILGGYYFIQVSRIVILQYLFLGSMRAGVPLLIVNIFSLLFSILLIFWGATRIFNLQLAPLLATSAALSVVLGLALQDTLGNLFAGISLQLDHVYEIGDWIETALPNGKVVGQVKEITWRATTVLGWTDETIVIPNRTLANSQISNFRQGQTPIVRSQFFRLPHASPAQKVKALLLESLQRIPEVRKFPEAVCLITDSNESSLSFKLIYYIDNFGSQYTIGDRVFVTGLQALNTEGLQLAPNTIKILQT